MLASDLAEYMMTVLISSMIAACANQVPPPSPAALHAFRKSPRERVDAFANPEALAQFEADEPTQYTIGNGDEITVNVWGHEDLSGRHTVSPDGYVVLPVIGPQRVAGLTSLAAGQSLSEALAPYYVGPVATVEVNNYASNYVFILGRVTNPGALHFDGQPMLLDVIARAGALPVGGVGADKAALNRCVIFRGRNEVIWINLKALLRGRDLSLNLPLRRGDVVSIPDADDQQVYVLGFVNKPGAYRLTPEMTFMDALAEAGGPTQDGARWKITLARPSANVQMTIDLEQYITSRGEKNMTLEEGDVIYVPQRTAAKVGYVLQQFNPLTQTILFGAAIFK